MDGAQNSLAAVDETSHETNNVIGGLAIETRGRFIQEEQSRLRNQLDTKSNTLALFNAKTGTRSLYRLVLASIKMIE